MRSFSYLAIMIIGIIIGLLRLRKQELESVAEDGDGQWCCPHCDEAVPQNFEKCWNCGNRREAGTKPENAVIEQSFRFKNQKAVLAGKRHERR